MGSVGVEGGKEGEGGTVWLRGRWRGSGCRFSVVGTVVVVVSSSSIAVVLVLRRPWLAMCIAMSMGRSPRVVVANLKSALKKKLPVMDLQCLPTKQRIHSALTTLSFSNPMACAIES